MKSATVVESVTRLVRNLSSEKYITSPKGQPPNIPWPFISAESGNARIIKGVCKCFVPSRSARIFFYRTAHWGGIPVLKWKGCCGVQYLPKWGDTVTISKYELALNEKGHYIQYEQNGYLVGKISVQSRS